jgi:PAS domain-containing protein
MACCAWALIERLRAEANRLAMNKAMDIARSQIRFNEAMISAGPEAIAALGTDMMAPLSYRGGSAMLEACLKGPNAASLASKISALLESGTAFALPVSTAEHPAVLVRGQPVGSRAVVFFRIEDRAVDSDLDFRAAMDVLPIAAWIRDKTLALKWANQAFLTAAGATTLEQALTSNIALDHSEIDLAKAASEGHEFVDTRRYTVIDGERRALDFSMRRLPGTGVVGTAIDVSRAALAEAQLGLSADANTDMMDHVPAAIAVFDADQHLSQYNRPCSDLWGLPEEWLDTHPTESETLDRLREVRRLPEQPDFSAWKRKHRQLFGGGGRQIDEFWHLPDGKSLRVTARPHLQGGVFLLFEDISDRLRLETALRTIEQVQQATLNTLEDGVAIFASDGRLKLHNSAFAKLWHFEDSELTHEPHLAVVARLAAERVGRDSLWDIVSASVTSSEPERFGEWSRVCRSDGTIISLSLARLPDGATLVTFKDFTDIERFQSSLTERSRLAK